MWLETLPLGEKATNTDFRQIFGKTFVDFLSNRNDLVLAVRTSKAESQNLDNLNSI